MKFRGIDSIDDKNDNTWITDQSEMQDNDRDRISLNPEQTKGIKKR